MDSDAKNVKPVSGTAEIEVNDLTNTGRFDARQQNPQTKPNREVFMHFFGMEVTLK